MRHRDGTPHVAGVPLRTRPPAGQSPGRCKAVVLATYLVGDDRNRRGMGVECDIVLYADRRPLYGVPVEQRGGVRDCDLWVPNATTRNLNTGEEMVFDRSEDAARWVAASQLRDLDGDHVSVEFYDGSAEAPVIVASVAHPRAERRVRVVATAIGSTHPAVPEGTCHFVERNGARLLLDWRGNVVLDTRNAGETNGGQEQPGDEPAGTVYVQARSGQSVRVSVAGGATVVMSGDDVVINGGDKGVARKDDETEASPFDVTANSQWAEWFAKVHAAIAVIDPTIGDPPTDPIKGTITVASTTVKAG